MVLGRAIIVIGVTQLKYEDSQSNTRRRHVERSYAIHVARPGFLWIATRAATAPSRESAGFRAFRRFFRHCLSDCHESRYAAPFVKQSAARRRKEAVMDQEVAPVRRRRMGPQGMMLRRRRIFARLRDGLNYEEIAAEEGVTGERIRQIVTEALQKRSMDSGADHAKLQLDRLAPVMQLAGEALAAGDVAAIAPYLKVLDRIDRYQKVGGAIQVYDDEARRSCSTSSAASPPTSTSTRSRRRRGARF
jgi:hypothetical protein